MAMSSETAKIKDLGLVVAAAGSSSRFGPATNKLLQNLNGLPVICHCLRTFLSIVPADSTVVLVAPGTQQIFRNIFRTYSIPDTVQIHVGGSRRQDSVYQGLRVLPKAAEIVAVQDGARPYSSATLLNKCVESARTRGSGVAARRVVDTIKIAEPDGKVLSTPDRATLWAVETPQVFQRILIENAYHELIEAGRNVTDDAQALELVAEPVFLVEHHEKNNKITYARDLGETQ